MSLEKHFGKDGVREGARAVVVATPGVAPRHGGGNQGGSGLRGQCWWLMRHLPLFTINELLETYADGTEKGAHNNIAHYLRSLEACDVVERLRRRAGDSLTSPGYVVWRLKRNLGVLAPVWRRQQKALWDPNAGQILPLKATQLLQEKQGQPVPSSEPDSHD
jgi:hypothetical protein